jgi:hypothetical protein
LSGCKSTVDDPWCSLGGTGVYHINKLGQVKYKLNGVDITVPENEKEEHIEKSTMRDDQVVARRAVDQILYSLACSQV